MRPLLIGLVAFTGIFLLEAIFHTVRYFSDRKADELRRRLQSLGSGEAQKLALLREGRLSANAAFDSLLRGIPIADRLEELLEQAELNITVARLLVYMGVSGLAAFTLGLLGKGGVLLSAVLIPLGAVVPLLAVLVMRDRRSVKISAQLPDALEMMARSLRAGHALSSSFKMVANEMPQPISLEFARAFEEQNLGMTFERAVEKMTKRAPTNRDLKIFAVSVIVQKETGGNLVEIIEKIADTIRQRYRFYGKLATLTAEGRMSSYVLGALPILTGLFIAFTNPPYVALLFTTDTGKMIFAYAFVSWLLGFVWLRRMGKVAL